MYVYIGRCTNIFLYFWVEHKKDMHMEDFSVGDIRGTFCRPSKS